MFRMNGRAPLIRALALCAALLMGPAACRTATAPGAGYEVEWFDGPGPVPASHEGLEERLSLPWPDSIEVRSGGADAHESPITLESCRDYLEVADRRVSPFGGGSFTFSLFQARALDCQAMVLALAAQPAAVSHLRTLAFDETLPDELPWQVAMIVSGAEAERIATGRPQATWREALFEPLTEYSSCGNYCGRYGDPGQVQSVMLVARGDFDGDGIEDMLLGSSDAATGGSYRAVRMLLLTRRTPEAPVELIRELEY